MTNEEILKKSIEKAEVNGYRLKHLLPGGAIPFDYAFPCRIIFSHDFAKAFWGEKSLDCDCSHECNCECFMCKSGWQLLPLFEIKEWEYHLMKMVLYQNPLEYLENFI